MADTTNYGWTKPTVGGDSDTWGTKLNTLFDAIDTDLQVVDDVADAAMPKAGGAFTGEVGMFTDKWEIAGPSSSAGALEIDLALARFFHFTITEATTISFSNVPATGDAVFVVLEITDGGAISVTWPASVKWPGGSAPSLTASGVDIITLYTRDGGTTWRGARAQEDSS